MANTLDGILSPFSNITLARFGGWKVKLVRDDGVILTPTTLLQSDSKIIFLVRDENNVSRILVDWTDGVFSEDAEDIGKNFKFNETTGFWTFNFASTYSSGWTPADSPLGFKLIIIPRNSQNVGELSNDTIDTQKAADGNGGTFERINLGSDFDTQDNLIIQGSYTVNMPLWRFVAEANPTRLISIGGEVEDPTGLFNNNESIRCGSVVEISIPHEINYVDDNGTDGNRTYSTDQGDTGVSASFLKATAGHLGTETYRWKQADTVKDPPDNVFTDDTPGDCAFKFQGNSHTLGSHTFTPKNFDFI